MNKKILIRLTSLLVAVSLLAACEKTPMEKAQDAYDASQVVPVVLSTTGPSLVLQTFSYDYSVDYFRAGSTWSWSAVDATVSSVSQDTEPQKYCSISFRPAERPRLKWLRQLPAGLNRLRK